MIKDIFLNIILWWNINWSRISSISSQWSKKKKDQCVLVNSEKLVENLWGSSEGETCFLASGWFRSHQFAPTAIYAKAKSAQMTYIHKLSVISTIATTVSGVQKMQAQVYRCPQHFPSPSHSFFCGGVLSIEPKILYFSSKQHWCLLCFVLILASVQVK